MISIQEVDKVATYRVVEREFELYRLNKFCEINTDEPAVTQSYEYRLHNGATGMINDSTARAGIKNAEIKDRLMHCKRIEAIVNKLHPVERLIIENRYMKEYMKDYQVYNFVFDPPISEKTYRKWRWNAVQRIASALNILQY